MSKVIAPRTVVKDLRGARPERSPLIVEELREHPRYAVAETLLRVTWLDTNGDLKVENSARPIDVSAKGMSVELSHDALLTSRVRLESCVGELVGHGKVRNCRKVGAKYTVGIEFTESLVWRAPETPVTGPIPLWAPKIEEEPATGNDNDLVNLNAATQCPDELLWSEELDRNPPATEAPVGAMPPSPVPQLWLAAGTNQGSLAGLPMAVKAGVPLALVMVLGSFMIGVSGKTAASGAGDMITSAVGEQGWVTEWASDSAGSRHGRQITLYRPSMQLSDYRMQFTGQIESKALGWVFRAADSKNYYGMKIEKDAAGNVLYTRFAVVHGFESSVTQRRLPIQARTDTAYNVRLEAKGPRFAVYIQDEAVELWTDTRLTAGALGFMNDTEERGRTSSVRFSF